MHAELPVLSFLCAVALSVSVSPRRVRTRIADLSVVVWLLAANLIHGVNTVVWADNADVHVPIWCDITTKFLLGAVIAIPVACLCIVRRLERISSQRQLPFDAHCKRTNTIIDAALCVLIPIFYMAIHALVQDHRFDLVRDYGCVPAIHPSTFALLIMWVPPLVACSVAFILAGFTIFNLVRLPWAERATHLSARMPSPASFYERLAVAIILSALVFALGLAALLSTPEIFPWSWSTAHTDFYGIAIIHEPAQVSNLIVAWWTPPGLALAYLAIAIAVGPDARTILSGICRPTDHALLPSHTQTRTLPSLALNLKSGWDDMLDEKPARKISPYSPPSSPSPSAGTSASALDEDAFVVSTLQYLGSPPAQTLGLHVPAPPRIPPPRPPVTAPTPLPSPVRAVPPSVPEDADSTISAIWENVWPQPPTAPPRPVSRHVSSSSSSSSTIGYPLSPSVTPPHLRTRPFEGAGGAAVPAVPRLALTKSPSRSRSREGLRMPGYAASDVIYMTVVHETA